MRSVLHVSSLIALMIVVSLAPLPAAGQSQTGGADTWVPTRLSDGKPDLQGVWDYRTMTPLQRPRGSDKLVFSEEEAAVRLEGRLAFERTGEDPLARPGTPGSYNSFWFDNSENLAEDRRTSLIVDPPDGRLPDLTPQAIRQVGQINADVPGERPVRYRSGGIGADGPEDRGIAERCIVGFASGPPIIPPGGYNQNIQLFQTPDYVVILNEMVHDVRIVPLDGRPHLPEGLDQWMGDSRGHWDGDTLVIETTNVTNKRASVDLGATVAVGTGDSLHLIERFSRVNEDTLRYEFTVDDPTTFTRPFTAVIPMNRNPQPIFEYACHEGNYGLRNLLAGARAQEKAAEEAAR